MARAQHRRGIEELLQPLRPIPLEKLDERAALLRRLDRKYVVEPEALARLIEQPVDAGGCVFAVKVKDASHPDETLQTSFRRTTLAARDGGARLTIDRDVTLARMDGEAVRLRDGLALVETKSEDGESPGDRALAELGAREAAISKYRTGIDALVRRDETGAVEEAARGVPALIRPAAPV